jgi:hypothetical protein
MKLVKGLQTGMRKLINSNKDYGITKHSRVDGSAPNGEEFASHTTQPQGFCTERLVVHLNDCSLHQSKLFNPF